MTALRFLRRNVGVVIGSLLIVGGLVLWLTTHHLGQQSFGWYLYQPLAGSPRRYADDEPVSAWRQWSGWPSVGLLVATVGLATLSGAIGYRRGRRDAARPIAD
jgi:heme/copper-type cytochrome/quinol oxidase subunit 1